MSEHYYTRAGQPMHFIPKKSGEGTRATTIKDARELGLLPSVSGIIKCAAKPNLERWKLLQACTAVLTSPRRSGEALDAFMERVLFQDKEGEQEAKAAADKGTAIHDAIASFLKGEPFDPQWQPYVQASMSVIGSLGKIVWVEKVLVGNGYAGRADLGIENKENLVLLDYKSTGKLPKEGSWDDHRLQTSAYAATIRDPKKPILTGNIYLSTKNPGEIEMFIQDDWKKTFIKGFMPLLQYWQWINDYYP